MIIDVVVVLEGLKSLKIVDVVMLLRFGTIIVCDKTPLDGNIIKQWLIKTTR